MYRHGWRGLFNTVSERHSHNLDVNTVTLCGCNFPDCHRTNIYEASERDIRIVQVKDARPVIYEIALQDLKNIEVSVMSKTYVRSPLLLTPYSCENVILIVVSCVQISRMENIV
jgi:hypothetical protein